MFRPGHRRAMKHGKNQQTTTIEACSVCAFKLETALATTSILQTPSATHYTAAPCHVLVAHVQMVVPLLARQCPDSSELGTWIVDYVECTSIVADCVARCKNMADCQHKCFCNATSPDCDSSQSVRLVDISAQHYLVMPCRPSQSKSTNWASAQARWACVPPL